MISVHFIKGVLSLTDSINIKILNAGAWARSGDRVPVTLPTDLEDYIPQVEEFYRSMHNGRKLQWHHHMSNGVVSDIITHRTASYTASEVVLSHGVVGDIITASLILCVQITFVNDVGKFDIEITTFQMAVLFAWNQRPKERVTFESLKLATELPDAELRRTLFVSCWLLLGFCCAACLRVLIIFL